VNQNPFVRGVFGHTPQQCHVRGCSCLGESHGGPDDGGDAEGKEHKLAYKTNTRAVRGRHYCPLVRTSGQGEDVVRTAIWRWGGKERGVK